MQVENFVNPVTGEEQDIKVESPKGLIWKIADMAKTKDSGKMLSIRWWSLKARKG